MKGSFLQFPRFGEFKRVLDEAVQTARADAAKSRKPTSPAYALHKVATTDAERRAAYAAFTPGDRDALSADWNASCASYESAKLAEHRADQTRWKAQADAATAAAMVAESARIASMPPGARRRAEFMRTLVRSGRIIGHSLCVCLILPKLICVALILLLYMIVGIPVLVVLNWRESVAIVKALPDAVRALGHEPLKQSNVTGNA